jgi:iron complex outermembrane receptor protein
VLFDRIEQRRVECGQPDDSVRLGSQWSRHSVGLNLNLARYGEVCSFTLNPADDQAYSPKWLTDLEASYQAAGYRFAFGAQNLFDVFPDRNITVNSFNGIQTFPRQSPFGMNGRTIYARIGRKF